MRILVLNGPNINFLGIREKDIYGTDTYETLVNTLLEHASTINIDIEIYQSNHEGDLIDKIQEAYYKGFDGIVFNPGGYTHTSISIRDAIKSVSIDTVEVHLTDINNREDFRKISYIKDVCIKTISGKGINGYIEALDYLKEYNESKNK